MLILSFISAKSSESLFDYLVTTCDASKQSLLILILFPYDYVFFFFLNPLTVVLQAFMVCSSLITSSLFNSNLLLCVWVPLQS